MPDYHDNGAVECVSRDGGIAGTCRRSLFSTGLVLGLSEPLSNKAMLDADVRMIVAWESSWNLKKSVLVYHGHSKSSTSNLKVWFLPKS